MNELYKNFKYKIGDKVWINYEDTPARCEVVNRSLSYFARRYLLALPVAEDERKRQTELYECDVFATKEELCLTRVKQCDESIKTYREALAKAKNAKARWEAQCGEREKEEAK